MRKGKLIEIKNYEVWLDWFESVYRDRPIEIDLKHENGEYRGTLIFYKKTNINDLIEI